MHVILDGTRYIQVILEDVFEFKDVFASNIMLYGFCKKKSDDVKLISLKIV